MLSANLPDNWQLKPAQPTRKRVICILVRLSISSPVQEEDKSTITIATKQTVGEKAPTVGGFADESAETPRIYTVLDKSILTWNSIK